MSKPSDYKVPVQTVLVDNQQSTHKPAYMFDSDTSTFYHQSYNGVPGINIYFGDEMTVSRVIFVNRLNYVGYLRGLEDTKLSVIKSDGSEEYCSTLTGVNTVSQAEADQTYTLECPNTAGVGIRMDRDSAVKGWCISKLEIYGNKEVTVLSPGRKI